MRRLDYSFAPRSRHARRVTWRRLRQLLPARPRTALPSTPPKRAGRRWLLARPPGMRCPRKRFCGSPLRGRHQQPTARPRRCGRCGAKMKPRTNLGEPENTPGDADVCGAASTVAGEEGSTQAQSQYRRSPGRRRQ